MRIPKGNDRLKHVVLLEHGADIAYVYSALVMMVETQENKQRFQEIIDRLFLEELPIIK